ncbi:glycosyltransferase [Pseudomonas sp. PB120]|uniref:glycosyltransferase family 4 protein n=1 Tax=Pseudomonas sp. PB120 TaxID=2494700 RepID=UPI0012FE2C77|nr:glycosyltransferase family 4 protein [Pseudomonas sp. PB120]MVV47824.1 glycosyltransferase [Pseudomonas sp. PB120]
MIVEPYILFTRISITKNDNGQIFTEPLWAKDLRLHLNYIENFGICCPVEHDENTAELEDISDLDIKWIFGLKRDYGLKSIIKNIFPNFFTVKKAAKKASIVHSDGAGWAFPLSFYLLALKPFMPFHWVIVIESSFWMLGKRERKTPRKLIEHHVHKFLLTRCLKIADSRVFTQTFYRNYFLKGEQQRTLINPATWVDEVNVADPKTVELRYQNRHEKPVRILFPSRLIRDKGVLILLAAIKKLKGTDIKIDITIMGLGPLKEKCQRFTNRDHGGINVIYQEPVDYGQDFFETVAEYDWVLIPTLKQEQPRIIFDAFSQGVPVIGSDTSGIRDITNVDNAFTFEMGNAASLAAVISHVARHSDLALKMGLAGLEYATGKTHLQMHLDREAFLKEGMKTC